MTVDQTVYLFAISFISFLVFNSVYNVVINKRIENLLDFADFKKFMAKLTAINDGSSYLSKDIKEYSKVYRLFALIVLSGFSLLIFNISLFSLIFNFFKIDAVVQLIILITVAFYIYQDFLKMDFYEKENKTDDAEYMTDILEKYTITNAIDQLPFRPFLHGLVFLSTQIIIPLTSLKMPKIHIVQHWIYRTKELNDLIRSLVIKKEGIALEQLNEYGAFTIEQILQNNEPEHVTTLIDKTPKENFPYIFDSEYYPTKFDSHQYQKKVCVSKIIMKRKGSKTMGYLFLHLFKGVQMTGMKPKKSHLIGGEREKKYETQEPITYYKPAFIFYIILIGEKSVIKSLETLLLTNSSKVPQELLMLEL
ncbi:MAG: hypothetical protein QXS02_01855 [Candidatus Thermoplasmatota archaeon]